MSDVPFGFGAADRDPERRDQPGDDQPDLSGLFGMFPMLGQHLQQMLSGQADAGPVNWDLAKQLAEQALAGTPRMATPLEHQKVTEAIRLADLWLDEVTTLPSGVRTAQAWTRLEWVDRTLPVWSQLCDPVASRVVGAMGGALPEEAKAQVGQLIGVLNSMGGMMFGAQVGQALAGLAGEVLSSTDIGLPLGPTGAAALLPANVSAFGAGLERPEDEVRLYLALREAAHHRLFAHVPWLRQRLLDTVDAYARGITVDTSAFEQAVAEIDPMNPQSFQEALQGGLFEPQTTPDQKVALARLETLLALVEGWVDAVVASAADQRLSGAAALRETLRRRRASGGPAEQTFATLVGLELRPRRLRDAARLWHVLAEQRGAEGRDAIWGHPDLLPDATDLDDPDGFAARPESGPDDFPELESG
jgi:putative hydrolase